MIYKWSWGIAWTLFGIGATGLINTPYLSVAMVATMGIAFIVAGVSFIAGK